MTKRIGAILMVLALFCALSACGHRDWEDRVEAPLEAVEAAIEAPFEAAENAVEAAVDRVLSGDAGDIGESQAKAVALAQAGLTESEVSGLRANYELDDGVPQYDVSFRQGFADYDVEVHAVTGAVLSYEVDN